MRVTGWSLERVKTGSTYTSFVRDSTLAVYSGGLGIISGADNGGTYNQHTADNEGRKDFFLFQFNAPVAFIGAGFNTYSVLGQKYKDSDATIKYGYNHSAPWNCQKGACGDLNLDGKTETYLNSLFDGSFESLGGSASGHRSFNPEIHWGNTWIIGSSFINQDQRIDGFKLFNLAVVPEPGTWLMMIGGFGMVGAAMRRQHRRAAVATA